MTQINYEEWLSIKVNLVLKPYYEDYQSLLFYEELDKVVIIVLTIFKIPSCL